MSSDAGHKRRILIVDDDAAVRSVLQAILSQAGYEVDLAGNGKEAIRKLAESPFDLMITDLVMPEQEGIETIKQLRRDHPQVKVIAMSGAFGGEYLQIAGFLGANRTLTKPIRMETAILAVKEVLES